MILLSFDIEEFDVPKEHGVEIPFEKQMEISVYGTERILNCLKENEVKATFFCTANFAEHSPESIHRIVEDGHEIASHNYNHWTPRVKDLEKARLILSDISGQKVIGYRQPRMMKVEEKEIFDAGYHYNSSLNPTFIPGRYMNFSSPRKYFIKDEVLQIPSSVTPYMRFPLFWLSYHVLPGQFYRRLCKHTLKHDGYLVTYFHPWEFYPLDEHPELKMPFYIRRNSGNKMYERLSALIKELKELDRTFGTMNEFCKNIKI